MNIYRIYTEATGHYRDNAIAEVAKRFESFTVYAADGYWKGKAEASVVLEIVADDTLQTQARISEAASAIRRANNQESVCITSTAVHGYVQVTL